jgi:3-oxoacyl-[acyl-carrier-protein] synthase III
MNAKIRAIDIYLPENILTNEMLVQEYNEWTPDKIENKTGIKERHISGAGETALDLALKVCTNALTKYDKNKIDFLILCTQSPDYFLPTSACILQNKLNLKTTIGAFDFNLGCSGYIYGLALAKGLISSSIAHNVLLVTSETYSKYIHPLDKTNRTIFADGATATIIEQSDTEGILDFVLGTDGSGANNLIVRNGALRNKINPSPIDLTDEQGNIRNENNLFMDGTAIFNFTIEAVPKLFNEVLQKNNLTINNIDYVIFHQANKFMIEYLRKLVKIPKDKFYSNILHTGNTVSSTIPIALKDCLDNTTIKYGDKVLILGFGVGYSWGGTIIQL